MTPDSITGLSIPRELVLEVLRGEERVAEVRRLGALADVERRREQEAGDPLGEAA